MNTTLESAQEAQPALSLSRTYRDSVDAVWELWTTREGLEAWWGPEGFKVSVTSLEVRAGGILRYVMTATAPEQVRFMEANGMPLSTETSLTYTDVIPKRLLAYTTIVDFVPERAPYPVATRVELTPVGEAVRVDMHFDRMHDEIWTGRMIAGWESELEKLDALIRGRTIGTQA